MARGLRSSGSKLFANFESKQVVEREREREGEREGGGRGGRGGGGREGERETSACIQISFNLKYHVSVLKTIPHQLLHEKVG